MQAFLLFYAVVLLARETRCNGAPLNCSDAAVQVHRVAFSADTTTTPDGVTRLPPDQRVQFTIFGDRLDCLQSVWFGEKGCSGETRYVATLDERAAASERRQASVELAVGDAHSSLCTRPAANVSGGALLFAAAAAAAAATPRRFLLELYVEVPLVVGLLALSGLFSGLNLGLMSLTPRELQVLIKSGTATEKKNAAAILPVRRRGNYLLCTLLIGNTAVNMAIALLAEDLTAPLPPHLHIALAVTLPTVAIVLLAEILPQAACYKSALSVSAHTICITYLFMWLTAPLSLPIAKLLDWTFGKQAALRDFDRSRLHALLDAGGLQQADPGLRIVCGALQYHSKRADSAMTAMGSSCIVSEVDVLSAELVATLLATGHTRIPVHDERDKHVFVGMLNVKDLALVPPSQTLRVGALCRYWQHQVHLALSHTPLHRMFSGMMQRRAHLAILVAFQAGQLNNCYEAVGLLALEDIIEEIVQQEIVDETDQRSMRPAVPPWPRGQRLVEIRQVLQSAPMRERVGIRALLAATQVLQHSVDALNESRVDCAVLQRLIVDSVCGQAAGAARHYLYRAGEPSSTFVLLLEGRIRVDTSGMLLDATAFDQLGAAALTGPFVPDFSAFVDGAAKWVELDRRQYDDAVRQSRALTRAPPHCHTTPSTDDASTSH